MAQEIYHRSEWGNPNEQWGNVYLNADLTNELYKRASEYENSWVTDQLLNGVGIKPSIILTPTAYEDGILNSVKPQRTYGSELVTNGSFDTDSDWTLSEGATISGGQLNLPNNLAAYQTGIPLSTEVKFVVQGSGTVGYRLGTGIGYTQITLPKTIYTTTHSVGGRIQFYNTSGSEVIIESASLKEVFDADFDFTRGSSATRVNEQGLVSDVQILSGELVQNGNFEQIGSEQVTSGDFSNGSTDWSVVGLATISNGVASFVDNGTNGNAYINQNVFTVGKFYKVTFDVTRYVSGRIQLQVNTLYSVDISGGVGTYTTYVKSDNIRLLMKRDGAYPNYDFDIDNVSVKEVGQNWTFGTGWSMGDGKAVNDGTINQSLLQTNVFTIGNTYKITFTISDVVGSLATRIWMATGGAKIEATANGDYTTEWVADGVNLYITTLSTNTATYSITNISVIEITDDTDLPRINYTNFDYKDVLGDELVTNGSFDTDSDWTAVNSGGWTISGGSANSDGTSSASAIYQQNILVVGKTYKITFTTIITSGTVAVSAGFSGTGTSRTVSGTYTEILTAATNDELYIKGTSNFTGSIDNISVKELTEDVVVPYSGEGSLLLEPQSTNLITYSEDFSQSYWTKQSGVTATYNTTETLSPDGTYNATKFVGNGTTGVFKASIGVSGVVSRSFYLKSVTGTTTAVFKEPNTNVPSPITLTITNEWQRFEMIGDNGSSFQGLQIDDITSDGLFMWGAQLEAGSFPTSYIPTEGSIKTRLADACNNAGSSDLINSTEGVLYAEISALADDGTNRTIALNKDTNDRIQMYFNTSDNSISVFYKSQGTHSFIMNETLTDATEFNKIAFKWKTNDFALWVNGTETDTVSSGVTSNADTLNALEFEMFNNSSSFYGNVKCVAVFKEALSDTELQKLTTI